MTSKIDDYDFLNSLDEYQLVNLLNLHPETASMLNQEVSNQKKKSKQSKSDPTDNRESQAALMAAKRAKLRDLKLACPVSPERRNECLQDAELFLKTYFPQTFFQTFTHDRRAMLDAICSATIYGGDKAIAGPRGEGKTRLALYGALYLMIANKSQFVVVIGKSQVKAQNELKTIRDRLQYNEMLMADFPEIAIPFRAVGAWSSRCRMQTVSGQSTHIEMGVDHLIFPTIPKHLLPSDWPMECEPVSNGQIIASMGIDGPIRGTNYYDRRPTLAIIDDIEDRKAAESESVIQKNEEIIEQDIGGLGGSGRRVSRVMLCTTQNRKCIAYKYTDQKQKPNWRGDRFRKMITKPDNMDLIDEYIRLRRERESDDPDARVAFQFWKDNQALIEQGAVVSNVESYDRRLYADGEPLELSAIQAYYNRVADVGEKAVATEDDNDPPIEAGPISSGISAALVSTRINQLARLQVPLACRGITAAIDLGKYRCHWSIIAWLEDATAMIVDYGVAEVIGTNKSMDNTLSEQAIYRTLRNLKDEFDNKELTDATGELRKIDFAFVDSGTFTEAAYQFCKESGGVYHPSKGFAKYRKREQSNSRLIAGNHLHAAKLEASNIWLYELDTDYWKRIVHEKFLLPTVDQSNMLTRGAMSLYYAAGSKTHNSIAHHICAEEWVTEFKEGKGSKTYWLIKNDNNHWFDAVYMATAASEVIGIKPLVTDGGALRPTEVVRPQNQKVSSSRFKKRSGGWVPKRRNQ